MSIVRPPYSRSTRSRRVDCAVFCVLEWPGGKVVGCAALSCSQDFIYENFAILVESSTLSMK